MVDDVVVVVSCVDEQDFQASVESHRQFLVERLSYVVLGHPKCIAHNE